MSGSRNEQIDYWRRESSRNFGHYPGETPAESQWRINDAKKQVEILTKGLREVRTGWYYCPCCKYMTKQHMVDSDCPACGAVSEMREETRTEAICECGQWLARNLSHCLNCSRSNRIYNR
jgi:hypothetical protein